MTASDVPAGFPMRFPLVALAGLDGLDPEDDEPKRAAPPQAPLTMSTESGARIRAEIERAGGREVCFLARVDGDRVIREPRAVARGNFDAVLVAARDADQGGVMLHNHPSGTLEPSDADMNVAAHLYELGLGTAIVDNAAERLYVVVEPPVPRVIVPIESDTLEAVLAPGGPLSKRFDGYEDRPGQREMLRNIVARFNEGGVEIVEAGTGTGKSLAYLLPAVQWALNNNEKTVISTNTINLQEQLIGKDLPLVQSILGSVRWALVKGRGNYVSIRRALLAAEGQASLFEEDRGAEFRSLLEWIETTEDGSLADLTFSPENDTWEEVRSDPDMCLRARCPHFHQCFYQNSRRKAASAELLVVNHHLLFTDLAVRRATLNYTQAAVLPAYSRVILDEAHNIEDAATSHLGVELTRRGFYRMLSRLDRRGRGILTAVHDALADFESGPELRERVESRVRPALSRARATVEGFVETMEFFLPPGESTVRLGPSGIGEPADREDVAEGLAATVSSLGALERELAELRSRIDVHDDLSDALQGRGLDLRSVERRIAASTHGLRLVLAPDEESENFVRWLEARGHGKRTNLVLAAAPVDLGDLLVDGLFTRAKTTVLTSATLTTRKSFNFLRGRLGLDTKRLEMTENMPEVSEHILLSPFEFSEQTLLLVPTDLPEPPGGTSDFQSATAEVVFQFAEMSDGGLFVLFTAHSALRLVAERLRARGVDRQWPLFVQGEDSRDRLLSRFKDDGRGILLGTTSFWEGVDVPGEALRGLVIQKLPFRVPTEPITAARMEAVERLGGDSFHDFMLPHAALRLKQGFGRLIRSRTDRGAVLVLDDRLVTKRYGRYLRDSLPDAPFVKGAWTDVRRHLEAFYSGH
ncbi:MAG: DEAD/DEAH box helicase [Gemmatimonadetes bacterium]|nr:DEAD/DEAH box helicase [Gemmatimonadota bacterium]